MAETRRQPIEDGIERNRQHHAPGQDRNEGFEQDEQPVDQQGQQTEANRDLDRLLAGPSWPRWSQGSIADVHSLRSHMPRYRSRIGATLAAGSIQIKRRCALTQTKQRAAIEATTGFLKTHVTSVESVSVKLLAARIVFALFKIE